MKKMFVLSLAVAMFLLISPVSGEMMFNQTDSTIIGSGFIVPQPELSTVKIDLKSFSYDYLKAIIEKDDTEYIYNIVSPIEVFPLQMGSGKYNISVLGSSDGRRYKLLKEEIIPITVEKNVVFLTSSQVVDWNLESKAVILTKDLIKKAKTDQEKFDIVHNYVINNISYDYKKATELPKGYIPNPDSTLEEGLGICYDFAALTASMLRSIDIPTKLVKGYSSYTPVYHAWNEVLINDKWLVIDTSTDSIFVDYNVKVIKNKDEKDYLPSKVY